MPSTPLTHSQCVPKAPSTRLQACCLGQPQRVPKAPPTCPRHALSAPSQCTSVPCPSCLPSVHASFWMRYSFLRVVLGCDPTPLVPFCLVMGCPPPRPACRLGTTHHSQPSTRHHCSLPFARCRCSLPSARCHRSLCVIIAHRASSSHLVIAHHLPRVVIACRLLHVVVSCRLLRVIIGHPFRASSLSHTCDPSFCTSVHCVRSRLGRGCKSPLVPHARVWGEGGSWP